MVTKSKDQSFDSGETEKPKLPLLKDVCSLIGKGKGYHLKTFIKTIFVNSKYGNITLVTEDDYRIILYKGSALYSVFDSQLDDFADGGNVVFSITPKLDKPGQFVLDVLYSFDPVWKHFEWGYVIENNPPSE